MLKAALPAVNPGFEALYMADFALQAGAAGYNYFQAEAEAETKRNQAYQTIAANNKLNYNAHLNLNEQQVLELQKYNLDVFDLKREVRREKSKMAAIRASQGGGAGQFGNSISMAYMNIDRFGSEALVRKSSNYSTLQRDFEIKHGNLDLQLANKTRQALSTLSAGGNALGTGLQIAGAYTSSQIKMRTDTLGTGAKAKSPYTSPNKKSK